MGNSKGIEIILISVTIAMAAVTLLFTANVTIAQQQADAFSKYDIGTADVADRKTDQKLQQDDIGNTAKPIPAIPTLPSIPTIACAKDQLKAFNLSYLIL